MSRSQEENKFWSSPGSSGQSKALSFFLTRDLPSATGSESSHGPAGRPAWSEKAPRRMAEKGVGTASPLRGNAAFVHSRECTAASGDTVRPRTYRSLSPNSDSEADVEALIDTESDASQPPSKGGSFAFSHIESRNDSMTSLSSKESIDSVTGRKRTLDFVDTFNVPIQTGVATRKAARTALKPSATSPALPAPRTPSRSSRARSPKIDSPGSYHTAVSTPTISRVCSTLAQLSAHSPGPSSRNRPQYDRMDVDDAQPSTSPGVYILAHSKQAQEIFDKAQLSWGVQYEISRGVSLGRWTWDQVLQANLHSLHGLNAEAVPKVSQVVAGRSLNSLSSADRAIWAELDREEAAIREGRSRGLGLRGEWKGKPNWYGGQIQQVARLEEVRGKFHLTLVKMEMRKSHRFGRFLGSRRLLQVSIPSTMVNNRKGDLVKFFTQRFILCGRVFVTAGSKDNKVFLMEINESYERGGYITGDEQRMSLEQFVNWHNPLSLNGNQPVTKYITRFDLGYSVSVPVFAFTSDTWFYIEDEYAQAHDPGKKAPAEYIYTDGCGFMNAAALSAIARHMGLEERPTAVQGRIAGAKGLWVLHPRDKASTPKIWIRKSQVKIQLNLASPHPAHFVFDLLAPPRVTVPSRLSRLTILNLSHNGVPLETFKELMKDTIDAEVKPLMEWHGPKAMPLLWKAVERVGGVSMKRIMQHAQGATRALGLTGRHREDDAEQSEDPIEDMLKELVDELQGDEDEWSSISTLRDQITGEPLTVHGVAMDLLQAGFRPLQLPLLCQKLQKIITDVIGDIIRDFHISIPLSAEAFIVPDPYHVLKPGEIHFKSTKALKDPLEDSEPHILLGDVLIYRNPNRLPSDVQKVKAVEVKELAAYTNVIVLPTEGPCSFASVLAGGDYDGDVCVCIYDPRLVEKFNNSDITLMPDNFIQDNFEDQSSIPQVSALSEELDRVRDNPEERLLQLQRTLLSGLSTAPIGVYSKYHENSIYAHGYDAPQTIRHAFMFNTVLDSRKTGHRVLPGVFKKDKLAYDREAPLCLQSSSKDLDMPSTENTVPLKRERHLPPFVLDTLMQAGEKMRDEHLKLYDRLTKKVKGARDADNDLLKPFRKVQHLLDHDAFKDDLLLIKEHILRNISKWQEVTREVVKMPKVSKRHKGNAGKSSSGKTQRALWEEVVRSYAEGPDIPKDSPLRALVDIDLLKASWTYTERPNLAWRVAFQALCRIKASTRAPVACTSEFSDLMSISASAARVLEQSRLECDILLS